MIDTQNIKSAENFELEAGDCFKRSRINYKHTSAVAPTISFLLVSILDSYQLFQRSAKIIFECESSRSEIGGEDLET